jgi:hypothetical protein
MWMKLKGLCVLLNQLNVFKKTGRHCVLTETLNEKQCFGSGLIGAVDPVRIRDPDPERKE